MSFKILTEQNAVNQSELGKNLKIGRIWKFGHMKLYISWKCENLLRSSTLHDSCIKMIRLISKCKLMQKQNIKTSQTVCKL